MITSVTALPNLWGQVMTSFPQGATLDVVIQGTGFSDTSIVYFSPNGVSVVRLGIVDNALEVTISVQNNAPVGSYELTIVTAGQVQTLASAISVNNPGSQFRLPVELNASPLIIPLNPGPTYDSSDVYLYRMFALPLIMTLSFQCNGQSTVEVYDADNQRFLLGPQISISNNTTFAIQWDGSGAFEPRVWKNGAVTGISVAYSIPADQAIPSVKSQFNPAPYFLAGGLVLGTILGLTSIRSKRGH